MKVIAISDYTGGIYNPKGEKVGKISHVRNKELLFLVE